MRHDVKRKEKHRDSVAVISQSDKIKRKRESTKSVEMMLGVLSRNSLQGFLAMRTRNSERNTGWYDPKIVRVVSWKWWDRSSSGRVLFYSFC